MDFGTVLFSFHFPEKGASSAPEGEPFKLRSLFYTYSGNFLVTMRTNEFSDL